MASHHRAPDPKREQFRRYLEKGGVIEGLTTALVSLYEQHEKPENALEFVKEHLGVAGHLSAADAEVLQQELTELRQKCAQLTEENKELREKLNVYEPDSGV